MARAGIWGLAARAVRGLRRFGARRDQLPDQFRRLSLTITQSKQNSQQLTITAVTGQGLDLRALVVRMGEEHIQLADLVPKTIRYDGLSASEVSASVDLADVYQAMVKRGHLTTSDPEHLTQGQRTATFEFAIFEDRPNVPKHSFRIPTRQAAEYARVGSDKAAATPHAYWAALGRFEHTELAEFDAATIADPAGGEPIRAAMRITKFGHVTVVFGEAAPPAVDVRTRQVALTNGVLHLAGFVEAGARPLEKAQLSITGRHTPFQLTAPVTLERDQVATHKQYGRQIYRFRTECDLRGLIQPDQSLPPHTLVDLWIVTHETGTADPAPEARARVGRLPFEQRNALQSVAVTTGVGDDIAIDVIPYLTAKNQNLSLMLEQISGAANRRIDELRHALTGRRSGAMHRALGIRSPQRRPVWLLGERPDTAQDNGLHLFHYLRTERRDIDAYYVITADSPDRKNLDGLDHVINFGSREHVDVTVRADRIVGTHHADYLFPTRAPRFTDLVRAKRVFLQHGVMGTKWMVPTYGKLSHDFTTDLVCVSSERERSYLIHDFGYEPSQVQVTGLARFDSLFSDDTPVVPVQVLIMPTWRDWLATADAFEGSEYFQQWRGLLEDPQLAQLREVTGARVLFYLHSNMRQFADHFEVDGIELVHHGDVSIQQLLKQSAVLLTDYSSPGFDFSFLNRPVIYFQFDRQRFLGKWGSHLDLDRELPGFTTFSIGQTLTRLTTVLQPGYELELEYRQRASRFIAHRDQRNCERITQVVEAAPPRQKVTANLQQREAIQVLQQRTRKSKAYFPLMRRMYALLKTLPMDSNTIVFESDVGKRVSDSPRVIYEELLRRCDTRRHVWIYDRTLPIDDPNVVVVKRLSPRYFYYLARAKYWITNQNFPFYITRRKRGVFVQTWHGTPLKRMLHDLDQIVGRDDGYVDRVSAAIAQWTHLISPSPYATTAFRSAFRYRGPVLELGYPRNDVLRSPRAEQMRQEIRARLGIAPKQQVVLYAPTFRDTQKSGHNFRFHLPIDLEVFATEFGSDTLLLLRTHMLVSNMLHVPVSAAESVRDMSAYPDIADLYLAADVLVTDYSSVMFDFALTGKPMIFFAYDLAEYRDDIRGFYLDYEREMPGPIATTQEELFAAIRDTAEPSADLLAAAHDFAERFGPYDDGYAAQRVVDAVFD